MQQPSLNRDDVVNAYEALKQKILSPCLVLSDIDGTLVHYPEELCVYGEFRRITEPSHPTGLDFQYKASGHSHAVMALPASSTGMQGYISVETLNLVKLLRQAGHKFVLISGARYATILERIPFLPLADAVVVENGGRIFEYTPDNVTLFTEDREWRHRHDSMVGSVHDAAKPLSERPGVLWQVYRQLEEAKWKLDARSYTTSFRVTTYNPTYDPVSGLTVPASVKGQSDMDLQEVLNRMLGLTTSVNLGKADIYPDTSGKEMATMYLMKKCGVDQDRTFCMCDDDNDLKMTEVVSHAYVPTVSSSSMRTVADSNPARFSLSSTEGFEGTHEALLNLLWFMYQHRNET